MDNFQNQNNGIQNGGVMQQMPPQYQQPYGGIKLATNRSLAKFILLSLVTFGIYAIVVYSRISDDINIIASRYDGKRTMHYCLLIFVIAPLTLGIGALVWLHKLSNRVGAELQRRNILGVSISAGTFWGWYVLGSLIIVGPFIYMHKLLTAMNVLSDNYNQTGM